MNGFSIMGRESHHIARTIRRPCISGSKIYHSIWTLGSFSCPTYGIWSCSTPLISNLNRPFYNPRCWLCMVHITLKLDKRMQQAHSLFQHITTFMWSCINNWWLTIWYQVSLIAHLMVPFMLSITFVTDLIKPWCLSWWKLVCSWKIFCY